MLLSPFNETVRLAMQCIDVSDALALSLSKPPREPAFAERGLPSLELIARPSLCLKDENAHIHTFCV